MSPEIWKEHFRGMDQARGRYTPSRWDRKRRFIVRWAGFEYHKDHLAVEGKKYIYKPEITAVAA